MFKLKPHNYSCVKCERKQYTNEKCYGCGGKVFVELKGDNKITITLSDEELDIIQNWGFIVSTERPLAKKEADLYYKITNG
ncbi:hypothetical protein [Heyndrickxia camelliae]|uniref:Uncharacterized protein n=1 Tax=Heyndrickxia camelliae TaxID=1707093 RepID=A0A2N3LD01_9BACI|nr:hypothetical protein [Heyndrickxia camelliae]PKR82466.1 hypothetical protein CWO92_24315 [Heyndrickxia camelliae]